MAFAQIGPIAVHYPSRCETNEDLKREFPDWDMPLIGQKTGIERRYIAAPNETAADLAVLAAQKLIANNHIPLSAIDYVLFCTQTPDYPLPTTACLIQDRLGLPTRVGALDFNLGCSGFIYGLSIAEGLIRSEQAQNILFLCAETYSKYIDPTDRSLRTIFGDAAAATLVCDAAEPTLTAFRFGTDGSGADTLLVQDGGARPIQDALRPRHRKRWQSRLYMDGPSLIQFAEDSVPRLVNEVAELDGRSGPQDYDWLLLHQATFKMLDVLRPRLAIAPEKMPIRLSDGGNTVSCTLPILIDQMRRSGELKSGQRSMLIGFGVGWSWAGCAWSIS